MPLGPREIAGVVLLSDAVTPNHSVINMNIEKPRRPRMRSWEADEEVARLLDLAVRTTGASLRDIVNEALRVHAPVIIRRLLEERDAAERELVALLEHRESAPARTPAPGGNGTPDPEWVDAIQSRARPRRKT